MNLLHLLSEEEKKERKKEQRRQAQRRYYQKNKEYYKNYNKNNSYVKRLKEQNEFLMKRDNKLQMIEQIFMNGVVDLEELRELVLGGEDMKIFKYDELPRKRVKEEVKHQGIGGQTIVIERELTPDEVDEEARNGNWACYNFCMRRDDFLPEFNKKLYYGHVGLYGYVVCEDEVEDL